MKIYFGEVTYNADEVFEHNGVEYDFVLEVLDEGIVIRDTCDRIMPISFKDTLKLMKALKIAKPYIKTFSDNEDAQEDLKEGYVYSV